MGLRTKLIALLAVATFVGSTMIGGGITGKLRLAYGSTNQIEASMITEEAVELHKAEMDTVMEIPIDSMNALVKELKSVIMRPFVFRAPTPEEKKMKMEGVFTSSDTVHHFSPKKIIDRFLGLKEGDTTRYKYFKVKHVDREGLKAVSQFLRNLRRGYNIFTDGLDPEGNFPPSFRVLILDRNNRYYLAEVLNPGVIKITHIKNKSIKRAGGLELAGMQLGEAGVESARKLKEACGYYALIRTFPKVSDDEINAVFKKYVYLSDKVGWRSDIPITIDTTEGEVIYESPK
jgi:hypothetical protein